MLDKSGQITILITGPLKSRFTKSQFIQDITAIAESLPNSEILILTWKGETFDNLHLEGNIRIVEVEDPGSYNPFRSSSNENLKRQIFAFSEAVNHIKTEYVLRLRLEFKFKSDKKIFSELNIAVQEFESNPNIKISLLEFDVLASLLRLDSAFNLCDSFFFVRKEVLARSIQKRENLPLVSSMDARRPSMLTSIFSLIRCGQGIGLSPEQFWGINFVGVILNFEELKCLKSSVISNVYLGYSSKIPLYSLRQLSQWIRFLTQNTHFLDLWANDLNRTRLEYLPLSENSKITSQFKLCKVNRFRLTRFFYLAIMRSRLLNLYWVFINRKFTWFKSDGVTLNLHPFIEKYYLQSWK